MLMPSRDYTHLSYQVIADVARMVDNHLKSGWIIRIEYTVEIEYRNTRWEQWGKPFFKIEEPDEVVDSIFECHQNKPLCSIRLHAEKMHPVSRLYYSILS